MSVHILLADGFGAAIKPTNIWQENKKYKATFRVVQGSKPAVGNRLIAYRHSGEMLSGLDPANPDFLKLPMVVT